MATNILSLTNKVSYSLSRFISCLIVMKVNLTGLTDPSTRCCLKKWWWWGSRLWLWCWLWSRLIFQLLENSRVLTGADWYADWCWFIPDICHMQCLWRNPSCGEISPHNRLSCGDILHICNFRCFVAKSVCNDLRTFVWRKLDPKIVAVEKKWQMSGICWLTLIGVYWCQLIFMMLIDTEWCWLVLTDTD